MRFMRNFGFARVLVAGVLQRTGNDGRINPVDDLLGGAALG
jgi:hypothetical protein